MHRGDRTYRNAVSVLLADALSLGLSLLEGVLVLELGSHIDDGVVLGIGRMNDYRFVWVNGQRLNRCYCRSCLRIATAGMDGALWGVA